MKVFLELSRDTQSCSFLIFHHAILGLIWEVGKKREAAGPFGWRILKLKEGSDMGLFSPEPLCKEQYESEMLVSGF